MKKIFNFIFFYIQNIDVISSWQLCYNILSDFT